MLKFYSHNDADAISLLPQISKYTEMAEMMKLPFWIFTEDSNPIGCNNSRACMETQGIRLFAACFWTDGNCHNRKRVRREESS